MCVFTSPRPGKVKTDLSLVGITNVKSQPNRMLSKCILFCNLQGLKPLPHAHLWEKNTLDFVLKKAHRWCCSESKERKCSHSHPQAFQITQNGTVIGFKRRSFMNSLCGQKKKMRKSLRLYHQHKYSPSVCLVLFWSGATTYKYEIVLLFYRWNI